MTEGTADAERHVPVMLERSIDLLEPALREPGATLVDATLGMAGHSLELLARCPQAHLIGIDRDQQALAVAERRLAPFRDRITLVHAVYDQMAEVLDRAGRPQVQAILMDLGVSSLQLDEADRGFAYAQDAPLDMRMDSSSELTAAQVLNEYSVRDLTRVLRDYGEERFARRIAEAVVRRRAERSFTTSAELVDLVRDSVPAPARRRGGHPAKRTFQALRIEVNHELEALTEAMPQALDALATGGRIVVMSYQSLEDRIVKRALAQGATPTGPPDLPVELPEHAPWLTLLTRGAETATEAEVADNPRAASVKVRAAERRRPTSRSRSHTERRPESSRGARHRTASTSQPVPLDQSAGQNQEDVA